MVQLVAEGEPPVSGKPVGDFPEPYGQVEQTNRNLRRLRTFFFP